MPATAAASEVPTPRRVRVCVRVRPASVRPNEEPKVEISSTAVVINPQEQSISVATNAATGAGACFRVDQVLDQRIDQAGVFRAAAADVVDGVMRGYNGTVLAYGQTGAGKTYTMSGGGARRFEDRGLCARSLAQVFSTVQRETGAAFAYTVRVSYVEVYNEHLVDLLVDSTSTGTSTAATFGHTNHSSSAAQELVIQENRRGQTFIRGLTRPVVTSEEQALELLFRGDTNRSIAEHCLNATSTRSHCIFTLYVERRRVVETAFPEEEEDEEDNESPNQQPSEEADVVVYSKLNLVDLAGSERMKKTHTAGSTLKEALHINKSLTFLEQVVLALGDKKRQHIPFRQSTLTNLLKDSLGGNCRTVLVACVWPASAHADQTIATLRFATRMMRVKTLPVVNVAALNSSGGGSGGGGKLSNEERERLKSEIKQLKAELAMYDALHGLTSGYGNKDSSSRSDKLERESVKQVQTYVHDSAAVPPIQSVRQVTALLEAFRSVCVMSCDRPSSSRQEERIEEEERREGESFGRSSADGGKRPGQSKLVAQVRAIRGHTPPASTPTTSLPRITPIKSDNQDDEQPKAAPATVLPPLNPRALPSLQDTENEKELFETFRSSVPTPEAVLDVEAAKQNLKQARRESSELTQDVNRIKLEIDALAKQLEVLRRPREASATEEDAEDAGAVGSTSALAVLAQLKEAKKRYRDRYDKFTEKRAEVQYLGRVKEQVLQRMAAEFQQWRALRAAATAATRQGS